MTALAFLYGLGYSLDMLGTDLAADLAKSSGSDKRERLITELVAAKVEQSRCMGGVDPAGCIAASKRITELRNALRDTAAFTVHLTSVFNGRPAPSPR
jgi:hypothetical protein